MAEKKIALPPPTEPFPGSKTPGWNDPPTLDYSPLAPTSSGRTRLNLNKRVAFPLQQGPCGAAHQSKPTAIVPPNQSSQSSPPMPMLNISLPPTTHPIAVVHPMQSSAVAAISTHPPSLPPIATTAISTNLSRIPAHTHSHLHGAAEDAISINSPHVIAVGSDNGSSTSDVIPTMFVPAMPRQDEIGGGGGGVVRDGGEVDTRNNIFSTIQQI